MQPEAAVYHSKMMKFGAIVTQTALKGLNLAQAGNYDHVLNLKYTCRALPSCFIIHMHMNPSLIKSKYANAIHVLDSDLFLRLVFCF